MSDGTMNEAHLDTVRLERPMARREFLKKAAALGGTALALSQLRLASQAAGVVQSTSIHSGGIPGDLTVKGKPVPMEHPMRGYDATASIQAKTFPNLATVEGISQEQLNQHIGLYNGYVKRINDIESQIVTSQPDALEGANSTYSPFRELHLEQSYALNGVILHEAYFENLGGSKTPPTKTELVHKIFTQEFGSWDNYVNHLLAVGKAMRGWAMTAYNLRDHRVHNYGLDLHNQGVPVYVIPLLVLDVYEHAYMIDFGTRRPAYLDAFVRNVDWSVVDDRLKTMMLHG
jgi:Fe-Mn family superoxide dismutase